MKNILETKKEIASIEGMTSVQVDAMKLVDWRRMKKKLEALRWALKYLQTNPTDDFVKSEIERIENIISAKSLEFAKVSDEREYDKLTKKEVSKLRKEHEKEYGIPKLRTQLRNLRFVFK